MDIFALYLIASLIKIKWEKIIQNKNINILRNKCVNNILW